MAIKFLNTATGITEAAGDNSTKIATTAYVDAAAGAIPIGNYLPLAGGTMTGNVVFPGEEANSFKIAFTGASASSGLSTVDQSGSGLYIGANSRVNNSGAVVFHDTLLPSSGIYFDGWSGDDMEFYTGSSGNPTKRLTIQADGDAIFEGNVGIGTTSPGYKLDVTDAARIDGVRLGRDFSIANRGTIRIDSNGDYPADILFGRTAAANESGWNGVYWSISSRDSGTAGNGLSNFSIWRGGAHTTPNNSESEVFVISPGLDVGIGTVTPGQKLDVIGTVRSYASAGNYGQIENGSFQAVGDHGGTFMLDLDNTGTADLVNIKKSGSSKFYIKNNGNVGIGTTSPSNKLSLAGSGQNWVTSPAIKMWDSFNSKGWYVGSANNSTIGDFYIRSVTAEGAYPVSADQQFTIKQSGNVGIGTISPETPLHVLSNTTDNASTMLVQNGSTGDASIKFNVSGDTYSIGIDNSDGDKFKLSYGAVGTNDRIVVDTLGNVGIGTTSPEARLSVSDDGQAVFEILPFTNDYGTTLRSYDTVDETFNYLSYKASTHIFNIGDDEKMRISSSGNVGIGTTSPDVRLEVVEASPTDGIVADFVNSTNEGGTIAAIKLSNADADVCDVILGANRVGANFGSDFFISPSDGVDGTNRERFRITEDGNVGIGTGNPVYKLDVSGTGRFTDNLRVAKSASPTLQLFDSTHSIVSLIGDSGTFNVSNQNVGSVIFAKYDGNVGIGTTSPNQKLHVNGATQLGGYNPTVNFGTVALKVVEGTISTGPTLGSGTVGAQAVLYSNGAFGMYTGVSNSGDTWMQSQRNDASTATYDILLNPAGGNVGIGTTSPSGKLDVAGDIRLQSDNQIYFGATGSIPYWTAGIDNTTNNNFVIGGVSYYSGDRDILLTPVNNGNVGIGTTSPSQLLHVAGNMRLQNQLYDSTNSLGTNGEVLTKVSAGTEWKVPAVNAQILDNTAAASAANVGTIRYRSTSSTSFVDMSMQTGATTYTWVNIVSNFW